MVPFPFDGFAVEEDGGTTVDLIESSDMVLQPKQKKNRKQKRKKQKREKRERRSQQVIAGFDTM